jgi:hypothetical protein
VRSIEKRVDEIACIVAMGSENGECIVASRVSPHRAVAAADKFAAIKTAIAHMKRELRNVCGGKDRDGRIGQ